MADVFISYAREDREPIKRLGTALEAAGYSVWWDREIRTGEDFDEVIERELENAACVIVAWSKTSRVSRYVKGEAREAVERGVLAPIFLEPAKPPMDLRSLHTEDFSKWQGDKTAACWERLLLQVDALKEDAEKNKTPGEQSKTQQPLSCQPEEEGDASHTLPIESTRTSNPAASSFHFLSALGLTVLPVLGLIYFANQLTNTSVMAIALCLAVFAFFLFRQADRDLKPHWKALATRWLLPEKQKAEVNSTDAFLRLFEAVFGAKHWSWKCFRRSILASCLAFGIIFTGFLLYDSEVVKEVLQDKEILYTLLFFMCLTNIIGDFFSLWETRLLLHYAIKRPAWIAIIVVVDVFLTFLIWALPLTILMFFLEIMVSLISGRPVDVYGPFGSLVYFTVVNVTKGYLNPLNQAVSVHQSDYYIVWTTLLTSYITSIWLWLVLLTTPIARALLWSKVNGLTRLAQLIDVRQKPFTALGYVVAMIIMVFGVCIWGITSAIGV